MATETIDKPTAVESPEVPLEDDPLNEVDPDESWGDDEWEADPNPIVEGTTGQLGWDVGGKKPQQSQVKLGGSSADVEGQYEKGDLVTFEVVGRVGEVHFVDKADKNGHVVDCTRRHLVKVVSVRRVSDE